MPNTSGPDVVVARMFHNIVIAAPAPTALWDRLQIHQVLEKLTKYLDAKQPPALILDLERVERISSESIRALLKIRDHALGQNCLLRLCNLQPPVHEVLRITELTRLFEIYADVTEACQGLVPEGP